MNKTVIISCAGKGSRLNLNIPKCLLELDEKALIQYQIDQLRSLNVEDIRVVVGYKKDEVIKRIETIDKNVKIYENDDYENTGAAGSIMKALDGTEQEYVILLVGDLLVKTSDMKKIIEENIEFVCGEKINTKNPIFINTDNNNVISVSKTNGEYEWSGLVQIKKERVLNNV